MAEILRFRPEKAFGFRRRPLPPRSREAGDAPALNLLLCQSWTKLLQGRESPTISTKLQEMSWNSVD